MLSQVKHTLLDFDTLFQPSIQNNYPASQIGLNGGKLCVFCDPFN